MLGDGVAAATRPRSQEMRAGERAPIGCRSGAGITSSVIRSTPRCEQPVADRPTAAERPWLDVVERDGERAAQARALDASRVGQLGRQGLVPAGDRGSAQRGVAARASVAAARIGAAGALDRAQEVVRVPGPEGLDEAVEQRRRGRAVRGDDGRAAGGGLERGQPEGLVGAGEDDAARAGVLARELGAVGRRSGCEADRARASPELAARSRSVSPAGPVPSSISGQRLRRGRGRLEQVAQALLAREAPDVQDVVAAGDAGGGAKRDRDRAQAQGRRAAGVDAAVDTDMTASTST